jgi:Glycosyl transferase family 2
MPKNLVAGDRPEQRPPGAIISQAYEPGSGYVEYSREWTIVPVCKLPQAAKQYSLEGYMKMSVPPCPKLSVVVPFFNEEDSIKPMHAALTSAIDPLRITYEMVFVDDGSRDRTLQIATEVARGDPRVIVVKFRRNYGQTAAMAAGIEQARGEVIVTLDGDLQNDPADIEHLLAKMDEGYDIVQGWRYQRQDKMLSRKIPSMIANRLIASVTGIATRDNGCSLKAYRAALIKSIPLYSEMHRFIPAMASVAGPRFTQIKVRHHARRFGKSKYGLSRIYKVALDLLVIKTVTSFTSRPLLWFAMLSLPLMALAAAAFTYTAWVLLDGNGSPIVPIAGSGLIFCAGAAMLVSSGALAELVYRTGDVRERNFSRLTQQYEDGRGRPANP